MLVALGCSFGSLSTGFRRVKVRVLSVCRNGDLHMLSGASSLDWFHK